MELNPIEIANKETPQLAELTASIQAKAPSNPNAPKNTEGQALDAYLSGNEDLFSGVGITPKKQKISMVEEVSIAETHSLNSGGDWISKYPTYKLGRDNAEYAAQMQSTSDKWINGLTKAGVNFATTVVGNTAGLVYGVAEGAKNTSWNAVFDNGFSNYLADINGDLNLKLQNYVSKDEQDDNFFESFGNANFWANDVAGAFSFTLGTAVSEAIWAVATGGSANIAKAGLKAAQLARWSKDAIGTARALEGVAGYTRMVDKATRSMFMASATSAAKKATWANTARFLATTSGNEAGIEALHYKREMTENFYDSFEKLNGREPSQEDIAEFTNKLENSANLVFATNMAILAPSNAVMFGSMFNIGKPFRGASKSINKTLFGIGVEKVDDVYRGITATTRQKVARVGFAGLKPVVTEGLWEEGLQGVTTKTAENWITSSYNSKYTGETMALSEATYQAFGEQYGTKEGWKEIGIGGIVGGGMSLVMGRGKFQEVRDFNREQEYQDSFIAKGLNTFGDNSSLATDKIARKTMLNSRVKDATEREMQSAQKGDDIGVMLAQQDKLVAEIQFRASIGEDTKELVAKYETALNVLPQEAWEEAGITNIEEYKATVIAGYKGLVEAHQEASDFADAVLGETRVLGQDVATQQLKEALTYSIVSGQTADKAMDSVLQDMSKILGEENMRAKSIQDRLQSLGKNKQAQVRRLNNNITQVEAEQVSLSNELQRLQTSKDETKGEKLAKVQQKLIESNDRLVVLKAERENLAQEVAQESKRRRTLGKLNLTEVTIAQGDFITGEDLATIDEKLKKLDNAIKSYEGVNHQVYYELLEMQGQYESAKEKFYGFQASIDALVSGKFKPKFSKVEGLMGKVFNSKAPIDDFTGEFLTSMYETYQNAIGKIGVNEMLENQYISEEEYDTFKETGQVSQETKEKIANAVKEKKVLGDITKEVYEALESEINEITRRSPNRPSLTKESLAERKLKKLEQEKEDINTSEERLEEVNKEIERLKKDTNTLTDAEKLRAKIEETFDEYYPLLTTEVDELIKDKPTKEEVMKYLKMYPNQSKFSEKTAKEFTELQERMQKWFMAQSLPVVGGKSIADLVEIIAQLETQVAKEDTVTEVIAEDLLDVQAMESRAVTRVDILQNVAGSAVAVIRDEDIFFMHIDTKEVLDKLIQNGAQIVEIQTATTKGGLSKPKQLTDKLLKDNLKVEGTVYIIGEIKVIVGKRGNIQMSLEDYNKAKDIINLHYFKTDIKGWSYSDLYEELPNGERVKKQSDYTTNTNSDAIYDLEVGEDIAVFVDMSTDWNNNLTIKALQEIDENNEISEQTKKEIQDTLEITTRKGKENNSTLKASNEDAVDDGFNLVRKRFADKFIETLEEEKALATLPKKIEMGVEVPITAIYLGTPDFNLDSENKPKDLPITERGAEKVITQGYIENGEIVLADKKVDTDKVNKTYVSNSMKKNTTSKIPIVILQKGAHIFAFPISLVETDESQLAKLEAIENKGLSPIEEIKEINNLLISIGSQTRLSGLSDIALDDIRAELESYSTHISAEELASVDYNKTNLAKDATAKIDLADTMISSPKITVDFSKATIGTIQENEIGAIELREEISKGVVELRKIINTAVNLPETGRFVKLFDENNIENQGSDIMNRKDVNTIRTVFFNQNGRIALQGTVVEILGKDRLIAMRNKLEKLAFYENQIKTIKDKTTAKKLNCI